MPRVPVATNDVQVQTGSTGRLQAPDFGPGLGAGLQALGSGLSQAEQNQTDINIAAAKQLDNEYVSGSDELLHTGADPFYAKSGSDSLNARAPTEKGLRDLQDSILAKATSDSQRKILQPLLSDRLEMDLRGVGDHAIQQGKIYDTDQTTARIGIQRQSAGNSYLDPEKSEAAISTLTTEYDNLGILKGWSPEKLQYERTAGVSGARKDIASRMAADGRQGLTLAQSYLDKFSGSFTSDDAASVQGLIRTFQNHYDAQDRAAAAEARRQQHEAEQDAAQRVRDGLRILETGTPLLPQQVASLEDDARNSGKSADALSFQVKQASFKNNLNVEWNNATPSQIGARVDELGAKIAKAGQSPDMQDVVEFAHLKQMQSASETDLRASPLHWASQHLGIQVGPLNFNDAGSIQQRIQTAQSVAARTGTQPQFLTPEEVAQQAPIWANGTAENKVALVERLSKLGPAGALAARQVAPHDPMLTTVVGLASVPGGVASALIHNTMAGPDAIKAHKTLVDEKQMQQAFNDTTGGALRLMPEAARGVADTSRNYFAGKMAAQGVVDYASGARQYPNAISSALGSYRDAQGVMRGGMGTHADAKTVLPVGVSQDEFDTKIARATPASFSDKGGGNSQPVWADGHPLTAGEVKKAEFVPVGDGRYALFSNGGFVQTKAGGRYELDWRKIP